MRGGAFRPRARVAHHRFRPGFADPDSARAQDVLRSVWCRKWHIVACGFFIGLAFFSYAARIPEVFAAETTILLDPRNRQIVAQQDQIIANLELTQATLESEVARLQSPEVIRSAIADIGDEAFRVLDPQNTRPGPVTRGLDWLKRLIAGAGGPPSQVVVPDQQRYLNRITDVLRQGLQVRRVGISHVIRLRVVTRDPTLSAHVANTLADQYIAQQIQTRKQTTQAATQWLSDQVLTRQKALAAADLAIGVFQQEQLATDGASRAMLEQRLAELNRQLALSRADKTTGQARASRIQLQLESKGAAEVARTLDTDFLTQLRIQREALWSEIKALSDDFGPGHTTRTQLEMQLRDVEGLIAAEVHNILERHLDEIAILTVREESLQVHVRQLEAQLAEVSQTSLRLRQLKSEAQIMRESYEDLLARLGAARAQIDIQYAEARVIAPAQVPTGPSAPRPKLLGLFGTSLGLSLGLMTVLAVEALRRGFSAPEEVERFCHLPVLAALPADSYRIMRALRRILKQPAQPVFSRKLAQLKSILDLRAASGSKTHLLISAAANATDRRVAQALAGRYAKAGNKVLFAELAAQSAMPKGAADHGFDEIIIPVMVQSEAECIAALQEACARYDAVVFYAPNVQLAWTCWQALPVQAQALLMVQWRKTSKTSVSQALAILQNLDVSLAGLVMTETDLRMAPDLA